jgi:glucose/mannose-6-phosphate isomerase
VKLAVLDDVTAAEALDPSGLLARIEALPDQCEAAWQAAASFDVPAGYRNASEVMVLGMGGSAIAGSVCRAVAAPNGRKPVHVVRGYDAPGWVSERTLAVACSHSGDTEETLSAFEQALAAGAKPVIVSTGGRLLAMARERGYPAFVYEYQGEPRSAIGHQLMALLALGERAGLLEGQAAAVAEAVSCMRAQRERLGFAVAADRNPAKELAGRLHGRLPVVIGAGVLSEAAYRWRTQIAENSKSWAFAEELPELDHNTIVGFGLPRELLSSLHAVFLSHPALHPRLRRAYKATAAELELAGVSHEDVEAAGTGLLAQALTGIYLGDFVSYYLALLNGVDPSPVAPIKRFKAALADK